MVSTGERFIEDCAAVLFPASAKTSVSSQQDPRCVEVLGPKYGDPESVRKYVFDRICMCAKGLGLTIKELSHECGGEDWQDSPNYFADVFSGKIKMHYAIFNRLPSIPSMLGIDIRDEDFFPPIRGRQGLDALQYQLFDGPEPFS